MQKRPLMKRSCLGYPISMPHTQIPSFYSDVWLQTWKHRLFPRGLKLLARRASRGVIEFVKYVTHKQEIHLCSSFKSKMLNLLEILKGMYPVDKMIEFKVWLEIVCNTQRNIL